MQSTLSNMGIPAELITIIIYIPSIACCIFTALKTLKELRIHKKDYLKKNIDRLFVVLFIAYGVFLVIFRIAAGLDCLNSLNFLARILGALGIYYAAMDYLPMNQSIVKNLLVFAGILDFAIIIDFIIFRTFRLTSLLTNVLIVCCAILLLNIACVKYLRSQEKKNIIFELLCGLHFCMTIWVAFLSGSRTMIFFSIGMMVYVLISVLRNLKYIMLCSISLLLSVLMLVFLFTMNFGDSQLLITKQLQTLHINVTAPDDTDSTDASHNNHADISKDMAKQSDSMRDALWKKGIHTVQENVLLGTGHVYFNCVTSVGPVQQTPHNFILESLIVFGLIGTAVLGCIILSILIKIFKRKDICVFNKISIMIMFVVFLGFAFFQQMLYNYILLPIFFFLLASLHDTPRQSKEMESIIKEEPLVK